MRPHRPAAFVLSVMAVAMLLSAMLTDALLRLPDKPLFEPFFGFFIVLFHGLGFIFALYAGAALFVTRRWHRVAVPRRAAGPALLVVGLSFPVLYWAGGITAAFTGAALPKDTGGFAIAVYAVTVVASAFGAHGVTTVLVKLTGRADDQLHKVMVVWATLWPFVFPLTQQLTGDRHAPELWGFSASVLLAWQLPIGLASALWFVRAGRSETAAGSPR